MDSVAAESGRVHRPLESTVKTATPRLPIEYSLLLTATLCLLAGGAVMVYSASSSSVLSGGSGGTSDLIRFVVYGGIGLVVLRFAARVGLDVVRRLTGPLLGLAFLLLIAVKLPGIGHSTLGQHAQRWIGLGPVQFEPSELMKLALVLYSAHVLSSGRPGARNLRTALKRVALVGGAACLLVGSQPDLGTTLVIAFALVAIVLTAGIPLKVLALTAVLGVGAVMLFTLAVPYAGAAADLVPGPVGARHPERIPVGPEPDRRRIRRPARARPGPVGAEGLLSARGADRLHPGRDRRGARLRRDRRAAVALRA